MQITPYLKSTHILYEGSCSLMLTNFPTSKSSLPVLCPQRIYFPCSVLPTELPTTKFGEKLRDQVEERLTFFESGETPRKNIDVMKEAISELESERMETSASM